MNITPLTIYLWQLADKFILFCNCIWWPCLIAFIVSAFITIALLDSSDAEDQRLCKRMPTMWKWNIPILVLLSLITTLTPSSNTIAMMVVIPRISESKVIQQDVPDIYNAAVEAIKNQLKK